MENRPCVLISIPRCCCARTGLEKTASPTARIKECNQHLLRLPEPVAAKAGMLASSMTLPAGDGAVFLLMDYGSESYSRVKQFTEAVVVLSHPKTGGIGTGTEGKCEPATGTCHPTGGRLLV